jgi:hypothetical protein
VFQYPDPEINTCKQRQRITVKEKESIYSGAASNTGLVGSLDHNPSIAGIFILERDIETAFCSYKMPFMTWMMSFIKL